MITKNIWSPENFHDASCVTSLYKSLTHNWMKKFCLWHHRKIFAFILQFSVFARYVREQIVPLLWIRKWKKEKQWAICFAMEFRYVINILSHICAEKKKHSVHEPMLMTSLSSLFFFLSLQNCVYFSVLFCLLSKNDKRVI